METMSNRLPTRFWKKIAVSESGCWLWTGTVHRTGYAHIAWEGRTREAHAVAYEQMVGPVPEGMELDHICHDPLTCIGGWSCIHRRCVNPAHLEPVPPGENVKRGRRGNHDGMCRNGLHPWDGSREECLECERARKRRSGGRRVTCPVCGEEGLAKHRARHARRHLPE